MVLLTSQEYIELLTYKLLIVKNSLPPENLVDAKNKEIVRLNNLINFYSKDESVEENLLVTIPLSSN